MKTIWRYTKENAQIGWSSYWKAEIWIRLLLIPVIPLAPICWVIVAILDKIEDKKL